MSSSASSRTAVRFFHFNDFKYKLNFSKSNMNIAFLIPNPVPLRRSSFVPQVSHRPTPVAPCMSMPLSSEVLRRIREYAASTFPSNVNGIDFTGVTEPSSEIPDLVAIVKAVRPVSPKNDHIMITLSVPPELVRQYAKPGQFCRLAKEKSEISYLACMASSPDEDDFEFLFNRDADPAFLTKLKAGQNVLISNVMGDGIEYKHLQKSNGDVFAFSDSAQGFAAIKAMIEWSEFRAITGEGANRTNHVTIYYSGGRSVPHHDRFSAWSVYGVNVVPLSTGLMEYLSAKAAVGRPKKNLYADFAIAAVSSEDTYEALFSTLVLCGFRRSSIQRFTSRELLLQTIDIGEDWSETDGETTREGFEQDIWENWVRTREQMRAEFERKWRQQAQQERNMNRQQAEKEQAWASWFAHNRDKWVNVKWDDSTWGEYWQSWKTNRKGWVGNEGWKTNQGWGSWSQNAGWTSEGTWDKGNKWDQGRQWSQQHSQEYWDWVGKGTSSERASGRSQRDSSDYREYYNRGGSWGNANNRTEWQRGYKYQYQEEKRDSRSQNGYNGRNASSNGWSGWNRNSSKRSYSSSSSTGGGRSSSKFSFGNELDLYGILGISSAASKSDIKRAYRKKAMQHHPDRNPDKIEEAHVKMKEIVVAWTVLKDEEKRRKYDAFGSL